MANLKDIRTRISSVKSTQQVTSAMKMVSASKLKKAQHAIENLRYYSGNLKDILNELNKTSSFAQKHKYTVKKDGRKVILLICSANKGLCGSYNAFIIKKATSHINWLKEQNFEIFLYIIGKKAYDFFKEREFEILDNDNEINEKVSFKETLKIANRLKHYFAENEFVRVDAVYNRFKNAVVQEPVFEKILPIDHTNLSNDSSENDEDHFKHILEPTPEYIANFIIPKFVDIEVYRILLDSFASEHGSRMTAMHQATENANELIKDLTLSYNKVRQASITRELVEIVSSAEALK